ncbi:MAG: hotdog fold domain-containing protein, partial [Stenotrophomonas sp.]
MLSRAVCFKAPYFASISPLITALEPGRCEGVIRQRRRISNHIGTVHAIAMCNLAELVGGVMVDASLPGDMRWIPKGMEVKYQAKALGVLTAVATPESPIVSAREGYDLPVIVRVTD